MSSNAAPVIWLEAETFADGGGWSNDSQFVDLMGSPYLLATGVGKPVKDAVTRARVPAGGEYRLWVRCKDWFPDYSPGVFRVSIGGKQSEKVFGKAANAEWRWTDGGVFSLAGDVEVRLHDVSGWWGRCDAVVLAAGGFTPANDVKTLAQQREQFGGVSQNVEELGGYDVVVVGGGLSGCGAAVAAARHGCRVALVQDRPVLGGNASNEIQIPVEGDRSGEKWDPFDTGVIEEFFPAMRDTAQSPRLEKLVRAEKNIELRLNTRATGVEMKDAKNIAAVLALETRTGKRLRLRAPLFIDCTGHGWIGYYAGADWRMGEEARSEYHEPSAPEQATTHTMGNDLHDAAFRTLDKPVAFEAPAWAYHWDKPDAFEPTGSHKRLEAGRPPNFDAPSRGTGRRPKDDDPNGSVMHIWQVEFGGMTDTITAAELIRDELFRINIGLWDYAKNHNPKVNESNRNRQLTWLNYVMGVRESRRLLGDYVLTENDYIRRTVHPDTVVTCGWGMDVHHPEGFWVRGNDCMHYYRKFKISIPFRSLYSRNIANLMMAGRCHSATHLAMGGTRIMRTCCEMGEATGVAAALIKQHGVTPRGIYETYIGELQQALLKDGAYLIGIPNRDPADVALKAKATASNSAADCGPEQVINGWNRAVNGKRNAWAPEPTATGPQWLQLDLPMKTRVNTLHISFQTRLSRGVDFAIETFTDGEWQRVAEARDNAARRRVFRFAAPARGETDKVRVVFNKVAGQFGVCEIRLYDEPDIR